MGWNGSDSEKVKLEGQGQEKSNFNYKALIAGLIVVFAGVIVALIFIRESETKNDRVAKQSGKIAEVKPAVVKPAVAEAEKPKPIDPNARPTKVGEVVNGYVKLPSGRIHRRQGVVTNSVAMRRKGSYAIFTHDCDNEIACLLTMKPGDLLLGTPRYNGKFKEAFLESLKEPIIVTKDDTPEQAALKRDVIQAKIEMKAALDRGEDIEKMMLDARSEMQDLMVYKLQIKEQFNEMLKEAREKDGDVEDLLAACNKMLEAKGIAPMKYSPLVRQKMMRELQEQKKQ